MGHICIKELVEIVIDMEGIMQKAKLNKTGSIDLLHNLLVMWSGTSYLLYYFSIAVVTDYHRFSGLKQHKFIILHFNRLEVWHEPHWPKSRCGQGCIPFWRFLRGIHFLDFSSFWRLPMFLGLWSFLPSSKPEMGWSFLMFHHSDLLFCFPLLLLRILVIILDPFIQSRIIIPSQGL